MSPAQFAFGQYCAKTGLFPPAELPATVTFHPERLPVSSSTVKLGMDVEEVVALPLRVTAGRVGTFGAVVNDSDPPDGVMAIDCVTQPVSTAEAV